MTLQTISQQRAAHAADEIANKIADAKTNHREFKAYIKQLPVMIHTNGVGQALAFYYSKDDTHKDVYDILNNWLMSQFSHQETKDILDLITQTDMKTYQMIQVEAQAYLQWLKQLVNIIGEPKEQVHE